ncbi:MAG: alpha/beta hydrolase [Pedobacter sp.]|nr:alpha/beta hydrolase [Pedobacter sp.]
MRFLLRRFLVCTSLLLPFILGGCANSLFYFPDQYNYEPHLKQPIPHEDVWIRSTDGASLFGWWLKAEGQPKATVVFLHGNAQNLTSHAAYVDWLPAAGYNVLIVDYRGYGLSVGTPTRKGVLADAKAAYDYALTRADATPERMILFGQSLGGANALTLAGREKLPGLKAVVADSAFSNYGRIGREKLLKVPVLGWILWPFSPLIVSGGLSPDQTIQNIAPVPLLLIAGDKDQIVPASHSQRLYEKAGSPKWLWTVPDAAHTEAFGRLRSTYAPRLLSFFDDVLNAAAPDAQDQQSR